MPLNIIRHIQSYTNIIFITTANINLYFQCTLTKKSQCYTTDNR